MKMLNKRNPFVVFFLWLIGILFSSGNCPSNSDGEKKPPPSTKAPNNSTIRQVVNGGGSGSSGSSGGSSGSSGGSSGSNGGSGGSSGSSGGSSGSSGGNGGGSSGSNGGSSGSSGGSSGGNGGGGLAGVSSSNSSVEDTYRNNTLRSRILKILEESDFDKNKKEAIKNYIGVTSDELLIAIKDNLGQYVTDNEVLDAIWELVSKNTNEIVYQSTGSANAINSVAESAASHGSASGASSFCGISIQSTPDHPNSCYMDVSLEVLSVLPDSIIHDDALKEIVKKVHNGSCKKDNYNRFRIEWNELPDKWKTEGQYQNALSLFLRDYIKPLLVKEVSYLYKDDSESLYKDADLDNLYQKLASLTHKVVYCNTVLSNNERLRSREDKFDLVAYVVRAGEEDQAGHFYACVKYKGDWYKSRFNGSLAVRKMDSMQQFMDEGESLSKVVLLVYMNQT